MNFQDNSIYFVVSKLILIILKSKLNNIEIIYYYNKFSFLI